jgi:predicted deacylase
MSDKADWFAQAASLPPFEVGLAAPDLSQWRRGNCGIPGFWRFSGSLPGPDVVVMSLVHGNEIAGAIALDRLLREACRPHRGTLTFGFANLDAFDRFDPLQPTASRFVDEDLNRLWDRAVLDGPRRSSELARARAIRPVVEGADILLDLHSMLWPSEPLILSGPAARGRTLGLALKTVSMVVSDSGHASGRRLIDYAPFTDPAPGPSEAPVAILVEAGQHWQPATVQVMVDTVVALLAVSGLEDADRGEAMADAAAPLCAEVTVTVTAASAAFTFVQPFRGGEVVKQAGTLIAMDGPADIRTPYDDCLLVMPSLRPSRGHTAVRLARIVPP